jgi:hypothetical protein
MNRADLVYSICRLLDVHPTPVAVDERHGIQHQAVPA